MGAGTPAPETEREAKDILRSTHPINTSLCEQSQQTSKTGSYTQHCPSSAILSLSGLVTSYANEELVFQLLLMWFTVQKAKSSGLERKKLSGMTQCSLMPRTNWEGTDY